MTLEANDRTEDLVKGHRSDFEAKQSTAQAPKKARGDCRLVIQYHMHIPVDDLRALEKEHGRQYVDGVDYGRALLRWLLAEGQFPDLGILEESSKRITVEVAK